MKKQICLVACLTLLLAGCANKSSSDSPESAVSSSAAAEETSWDAEEISDDSEDTSEDYFVKDLESRFNSYIVYSMGEESGKEKLDDAASKIKSRIEDVFSARKETVVVEDYDENKFTIYLNSDEYIVDFLAEKSAKPNKVAFRKGSSDTGEIIFEADEIGSVWSLYEVRSESYSINMNLSDEGTRLFAEAARELTGTSTPVSLWIDDECISSIDVSEPVEDGIVNISGDFDKHDVEMLAKRIKFPYLPYKVDVVDHFCTGEQKVALAEYAE